MTEIEARMQQKLTEAFAPTQLEIINESHLHAGHAGSPGTGTSHFVVVLASSEFDGKTRVQRHQMVNRVLKEELDGPVHALSLKLSVS